MKIKMKRRRTSTAALLAFTAHLLDVDIVSSATSTSSGSGTRRPSKSLLQRPSTAFSLQQRGRSICHPTAFVHQESAAGVIRKRSSGHRDNGSPPPSSTCSSHHQSSSQHTRSPSSTITSRTSPIQIWKQRNVSAHLTKNRIDDVTPRYYVSSSSGSSSSSGGKRKSNRSEEGEEASDDKSQKSQRESWHAEFAAHFAKHCKKGPFKSVSKKEVIDFCRQNVKVEVLKRSDGAELYWEDTF